MKTGLFVLLIVVIIGRGIFAVKMRNLPEAPSVASVQGRWLKNSTCCVASLWIRLVRILRIQPL